MKGRWAQGIVPRGFAWVILEQLAVSERPGGRGHSHRRIRRQEELLWIRGQGFTRIVSLLPSTHNLHVYEEAGVEYLHRPFGATDDPAEVLLPLFGEIRQLLLAGEKLLLHEDHVGDRLQAAMAGYLRWTGLVPEGPRAIAYAEQLLGRQMGHEGRAVVAALRDVSAR